MFGNGLTRVGAWVLFGVVACSEGAKEGTPPPPAAEIGVQAQELNLLCGSNAQCNDEQPCTLDLCIAGICVHGPNLGCCQQPSDCNTDVVCTVASCVLNTCIVNPILGCGENTDGQTTDEGPHNPLCGFDTDCDDGDPCTDDVCLVGGVCLSASNPLCCDDSSECTGVLSCHTGECIDHRCSLTLLQGCEDSDSGTASNDVSSAASSDSSGALDGNTSGAGSSVSVGTTSIEGGAETSSPTDAATQGGTSENSSGRSSDDSFDATSDGHGATSEDTDRSLDILVNDTSSPSDVGETSDTGSNHEQHTRTSESREESSTSDGLMSVTSPLSGRMTGGACSVSGSGRGAPWWVASCWVLIVSLAWRRRQ